MKSRLWSKLFLAVDSYNLGADPFVAALPILSKRKTSFNKGGVFYKTNRPDPPVAAGPKLRGFGSWHCTNTQQSEDLFNLSLRSGKKVLQSVHANAGGGTHRVGVGRRCTQRAKWATAMGLGRKTYLPRAADQREREVLLLLCLVPRQFANSLCHWFRISVNAESNQSSQRIRFILRKGN
jgi:hypothetical protein